MEDTGIGMDEENINKFNNGEDIRTTVGTNKEEGTGLGLAICRELIRLNNGDIVISSTPGKGTSVSFTLDKG